MDHLFRRTDVQSRRSDSVLAQRSQKVGSHGFTICAGGDEPHRPHRNPAWDNVGSERRPRWWWDSCSQFFRRLLSVARDSVVSSTLSVHTDSLFHVFFALFLHLDVSLVTLHDIG